MSNKKQGAIALAAVVATVLTMVAMAPSQASQTVQDRGTRISAPADATVVAFAGGGVSAQRSGR
jgi:hypothetical protein